jgi:hypothetical protein
MVMLDRLQGTPDVQNLTPVLLGYARHDSSSFLRAPTLAERFSAAKPGYWRLASRLGSVRVGEVSRYGKRRKDSLDIHHAGMDGQPSEVVHRSHGMGALRAFPERHGDVYEVLFGGCALWPSRTSLTRYRHVPSA